MTRQGGAALFAAMQLQLQLAVSGQGRVRRVRHTVTRCMPWQASHAWTVQGTWLASQFSLRQQDRGTCLQLCCSMNGHVVGVAVQGLPCCAVGQIAEQYQMAPSQLVGYVG